MIRTGCCLREGRLKLWTIIQAMLGQLGIIAETERCGVLAYLSEIAHVEAGDVIRGKRLSNIELNRRDTSTLVALETAGKVDFQKDHENLRPLKSGGFSRLLGTYAWHRLQVPVLPSRYLLWSLAQLHP